MAKNIKLQIMWASVILITVLMIGFLGVYALQKSMTIKMSYNVYPNIRCEMYIHTSADEQDEYNLMFSNISGEEYIHPDWQLFEDTGTLKYNPNFSGDLGSLFTIKVLNFTPTKVFAEVSGIGASYSSVALDAYVDSPDSSDNVLSITSVSSNYEINFYKIENYFLTANLSGAQFDLENYEDNTLLRCGNNYYLPLGEDLNGKLVAPQNATILFDSISTETYTYSTSTNILTILNANLTNTTLTARGVYYITTTFTGGISFDTSYASNSVIQVGESFAVIAGTNLQAKFIDSTANYHAEISSLTIGSGANIISSLHMDYSNNECVLSVPSSEIDANISITAGLIGDHYTVYLVQNGGIGGTTSVMTTYGSPMPGITAPTKSGSTFTGYYENNGGTNMDYIIDGLAWGWGRRINFPSYDNVLLEGTKLSSTYIINAIPTNIEISDKEISYPLYNYYLYNGNYVININVSLTSKMANSSYGGSAINFIDSAYPGTDATRTILVKNLSYNAYCYYDFNAHSAMNCDLTANTTLTAKWVANT